MRIGIDARAFGWAGLGRYARNLIRYLSKVDSENSFVVFAPRIFCREIATLPRMRAVPVTDSYYSLREQTLFLRSLLKEQVDLMHFLHFNAPVLYRHPFVVTIHDLTRFFFPAQKHRGRFHQWAYENVFRSAVLHARKIISVSEHTKVDLVRFFPEVAGRTVVIPEGVEHDVFSPLSQEEEEATLAPFGIQKPFLLFVGVWMTHKNLPRLLESFCEVRKKGFQGKMVITGEGRIHDVNVPRLVKHFGLSDAVVLPGIVSDKILSALFRQAEIFVFPSLYEGFGLPPLEAMACGTPVVASHVASIPEVLGEAAEYIDPLSSRDICRGIWRVLNDPNYRSQLVQKGLERAQLYQWKNCASETLKVYTGMKKAVNKKETRNES